MTRALYFMCILRYDLFCFFFNDTATTEIYTLSLHDALPISVGIPKSFYFSLFMGAKITLAHFCCSHVARSSLTRLPRSEEHTSELQSRQYLVCRLLLEKKKQYAFSLFLSIPFSCTIATSIVR